MKKIIFTTLTGLTLLAGCSKQEDKPQPPSVEIPPVFVITEIQGAPTAIPEARTSFAAGDEVILTGLIMGVNHPFVEGRAAFVLGDEATLTPCDLKTSDKCKMPWDACCDPAAVRMAGTATIQVLDENGKLIRTGLKGINGLTELSRVTVAGTVAPNSTTEAFIVNARAIHIGVR